MTQKELDDERYKAGMWLEDWVTSDMRDRFIPVQVTARLQRIQQLLFMTAKKTKRRKRANRSSR